MSAWTGHRSTSRHPVGDMDSGCGPNKGSLVGGGALRAGHLAANDVTTATASAAIVRLTAPGERNAQKACGHCGGTTDAGRPGRQRSWRSVP